MVKWRALVRGESWVSKRGSGQVERPLFYTTVEVTNIGLGRSKNLRLEAL